MEFRQCQQTNQWTFHIMEALLAWLLVIVIIGNQKAKQLYARFLLHQGNEEEKNQSQGWRSKYLQTNFWIGKCIKRTRIKRHIPR